MAFGGLGWLTFLYLPLATYLLTYLEVIGVLAEAPLMLWLVVMGVNGQRWEAIANTRDVGARIELNRRV